MGVAGIYEILHEKISGSFSIPITMSVDYRNAADDLSRAAFDLLLEEPFYAHVLAGMPRDLTEQIATVGLYWNGQQMVLRVNPEWFCKGLAGPQRKLVLKHEVLHVVFRHVFRPGDREAQLYSIAADLVVNQLISPFKPLTGWPTLPMFPELGLKPNRTVDVYYAALAVLLRMMLQAGFAADEPSKGTGAKSKSNGRGKVDDWAKATGKPESAMALARLLTAQGKRGDDSGWDDGRDAMGAAAGCYAVGSVLIRARERMPLDQWGSLPAALLSELERIMADRQPQIDWKRTVRIFCSSSGRTIIRHTSKRISKRYGTRPGIKVKRLQRILVAVDTSGSIDQATLEIFFTEIHAVWRAGATVHIVECDADMQRDYEYSGQTPSWVSGGGGTEFEPVFRWMQNKTRFDGMLYLTDGVGPAPETPPGCRMLWVVSGSSSAESAVSLPFGATVHLSTN